MNDDATVAKRKGWRFPPSDASVRSRPVAPSFITRACPRLVMGTGCLPVKASSILVTLAKFMSVAALITRRQRQGLISPRSGDGVKSDPFGSSPTLTPEFHVAPSSSDLGHVGSHPSGAGLNPVGATRVI